MFFLIWKFLWYLLTALLAGFAGGWLFRNLLAVQQEELQQNTLNDTRSKLPQFESQPRGSDRRLENLEDDLARKNQQIQDLMDAANAKERALLKKSRELKRLTQPSSAGDGKMRRVRIAELEKDLERAVQARRQAEANALVNTTDADRDSRQVTELEIRLRRQSQDFERLGRSLEQERRKVVELKRERALQHKSLMVLHQQLEHERDQVTQRSSG
ncbi:MAG: hypothetical protein O7E57_05830 [Gammaproteobacteria bacterium]|nr:hypothetical protein [Gammaproteobacteria bacterium]